MTSSETALLEAVLSSTIRRTGHVWMVAFGFRTTGGVVAVADGETLGEGVGVGVVVTTTGGVVTGGCVGGAVVGGAVVGGGELGRVPQVVRSKVVVPFWNTWWVAVSVTTIVTLLALSVAANSVVLVSPYWPNSAPESVSATTSS